MLEQKIDFMVTIEVREANANGDPLSGNMPRTNANNQGIISDVAIKRKIRNRMQDMGHSILSKQMIGLKMNSNLWKNVSPIILPQNS